MSDNTLYFKSHKNEKQPLLPPHPPKKQNKTKQTKKKNPQTLSANSYSWQSEMGWMQK